MGNVTRLGFARFGVWLGQFKPGFARSGVWPGWFLSCWLTQANTYTFASSQALLHDSRKFVCPNLRPFLIALTRTRPCVPWFSRSGSCKVQANFTSTFVLMGFVGAVGGWFRASSCVRCCGPDRVEACRIHHVNLVCFSRFCQVCQSGSGYGHPDIYIYIYIYMAVSILL